VGAQARRTGNGLLSPADENQMGGAQSQSGTYQVEHRARKETQGSDRIFVHEMVHLAEPTHSDRFTSMLTEYYPTWREVRTELNQLPLAAESWRE